VFQRQPPLLELVEIFWPGGEEDRHARIRQHRVLTYPIRESRARQPVPHQCDGLANWTDRGGKPSARVDHPVPEQLKWPSAN
jgi:hypothetical protein